MRFLYVFLRLARIYDLMIPDPDPCEQISDPHPEIYPNVWCALISRFTMFGAIVRSHEQFVSDNRGALAHYQMHYVAIVALCSSFHALLTGQ